MKTKNVKNRVSIGKGLSWREVWERKYAERSRKTLGRKLGSKDWSKFAKDYSERAKFNDYEYGRKAVEAIREIMRLDFKVLDIGAGAGALAIPFARKVRKVTAIEPSREMVRYLKKNAEEEGIENLEIVNKSWQEVDVLDVKKNFDIVACSHLLWQFKDVDRQLKRMENASKRYCCVVHPAGGRDAIIGSLWSEAMGRKYAGELDPDLDDLVFVMLRERGILVNVKVIDYAVRLSLDQGERYIESLLRKYREITPALRKAVRKRILEKSRNGVYERESNAAVIWWRVPILQS